MNHGRKRERCVCRTPCDHNLCAGAECFGQRKRADVRVGALDLFANRLERLARVHIRHSVAFAQKLIDAAQDVIPEDNRDFDARRRFAHSFGAGHWVDAAGIRNDAHVALHHALGDAADERRKITCVA